MDSTEHQAGVSLADIPPKGRIFLNVLSPSSEIPQKLTFPNIPISTTIRELKHRIQNDVATKPAPDRQRLIYRGRALVQEEKTLEDVFGHEAVRSQLESSGFATDQNSRSTVQTSSHYTSCYHQCRTMPLTADLMRNRRMSWLRLFPLSGLWVCLICQPHMFMSLHDQQVLDSYRWREV